MSSTVSTVDTGLRSFLVGVYNKLFLGLLVTAALAWLTAYLPAARELIYHVQDGKTSLSILGWIVTFAPLFLVLFVRPDNPASSGFLYWAVAALFGISMGSVFLVYTATSVFSTFLITSAMFAGLSLFGYTTKINLDAVGTFFIAVVWGLILAMIVNLFLHSSVVGWLISVVGVVAFSALTAYDTQKLKEVYYDLDGEESAATMSNVGALTLYLDFINLFMFLLRFIGVSKDD